MNFSGKITNSFLNYLHKSTSTDLAEIVDGADLPIEFLRDPTCWLPAQKVETFLRLFENYALQHLGDDSPIEKVGHSAKELKSWGVLDSVLCMIERPNDIFLQPQRFISYFISPAPPIANIIRGLNSVTFDLPISFEEFPMTLTYLRSAIESVPLFTGTLMAECRWKQNSVSISWHHLQPSLDDPSLSERKMAPEVMQNLILTLEKTELALHEKTIELDNIKLQNQLAAQSALDATSQAITQVQSQPISTTQAISQSQMQSQAQVTAQSQTGSPAYSQSHSQSLTKSQVQSQATSQAQWQQPVKSTSKFSSQPSQVSEEQSSRQIEAHSTMPMTSVSRQKIEQQVLKLQDYFTRSQQLITLLIGQDRNSSQIREAMKRVSWERVQESFPQITKEIINQMNDESFSHSEIIHEQNHQSIRPRDSRQPWLPNN